MTIFAHDLQAIQDRGWLDALIDAAREYGGSRGVNLAVPDRPPASRPPDFSGPEFDHLDGGGA